MLPLFHTFQYYNRWIRAPSRLLRTVAENCKEERAVDFLPIAVYNGTMMNKQKRKGPELLAPAGNMEKLKAALRFGADAVYLAGQRFGMRAGADNFDLAEMKQAVEYAHALGKKVYLTVNTMPRTTRRRWKRISKRRVGLASTRLLWPTPACWPYAGVWPRKRRCISPPKPAWCQRPTAFFGPSKGRAVWCWLESFRWRTSRKSDG